MTLNVPKVLTSKQRGLFFFFGTKRFYYLDIPHFNKHNNKNKIYKYMIS